MKKKLSNTLKKLRNTIAFYLTTNRLFISYVVLALIGTILLRNFTIGNTFSFKPFIADLAAILLIGAFGYIKKPEKRYKYYFICLIIFTIAEVVNSVYYTFYTSFASFGEIASLSQVKTVTGSLYEKFKFYDFIYIIFPIIFYYSHKKLKSSYYYKVIRKIEVKKKMFGMTLLMSLVCLVYTFTTATKTDYSRLAKQWNRVYVVERFGIITYQINDLIQSLTPKLGSLFGYDEAAKMFHDYFDNMPEEEKYNGKNEYTNILDGYNVILVHMEGMQTFLMDVSFNGVDAVPNVKKIASEGMFFKNFYPQISTGTSSDTEFTLSSSLMPAASGTVFVSYYNRNYITLQKLLKQKGYYTFSTHGNYASMWNRDKAHPSLGYEDMFFEESYDYTEDDVINLGINDSKFFEQLVPKIEVIEETHPNYMGTVITLSNHSPFIYLDKYGEYDMSTTYTEKDENTKEEVTKKTNYLYNTAVGNYITSSHYADKALGEFIDYINNSEHFNNTIFVFYGDHDAKLKRKEMNYLYNYNYKTGEVYEPGDKEYKEYNYYNHEMNKNTPLIFWTKNQTLRKKINKQVNYTMGMYDVLPTLGNMLGIENKYALGHDIFNIKDNNVVVFPNGNFLTNKVYYNNSTGEYYVRNNSVIDDNYIEKYKNYSDKLLEVSNAIIVHNLIYTEGTDIDVLIDDKKDTKENTNE